MRREIVALRHGEPWFAEAAAAFERIDAGAGTEHDWTCLNIAVWIRRLTANPLASRHLPEHSGLSHHDL
jgi:hypothetical protein